MTKKLIWWSIIIFIKNNNTISIKIDEDCFKTLSPIPYFHFLRENIEKILLRKLFLSYLIVKTEKRRLADSFLMTNSYLPRRIIKV